MLDTTRLVLIDAVLGRKRALSESARETESIPVYVCASHHFDTTLFLKNPNSEPRLTVGHLEPRLTLGHLKLGFSVI